MSRTLEMPELTTNGTAQTRSYNGQNQLSAVSGATTPTYDDNGNVTKDQSGTTYTYDAWNRMAVAISGSSLEDFGYLAGGQRASIAVSGSTTDYSYFNAAWQEVELDNNTGPGGSPVVQGTYVWGLANINELVARDDNGGNRLYAQQDANWDVTALVGTVSGVWKVVERFSYSPYGVATVLNGTWASATDSHSWVYRYQAGKYDGLSGLYNFRNRDYSPSLGRWLEADPAGYVQGANLYQANLGAPISHVDPYGLTSDTGSAGDGNNVDPSGTIPPPPTIPPAQPITIGGHPVYIVNVPPGQPLPDFGPGTIVVNVNSGPPGTTPGTPPSSPGAPTSQPATPPSNDEAALIDAAYQAGLDAGMNAAEAADYGQGSSLVTDESGNTIIVPPDAVTNDYGSPTVFFDPADGLYHAVLWDGSVVPVPVFPPLPVIKITTPPTTQPINHKVAE